MTDRTERNNAIIRQLEIEANVSAAAYLDEVEEFQRLYRLERMQDLVFDLIEWIGEIGDLKRLGELGVVLEEHEAGLILHQGQRSMAILPSDDMSIQVDGRSLLPNQDCPVLDRTLYNEVMVQVFAWANAGETSEPKRFLK